MRKTNYETLLKRAGADIQHRYRDIIINLGSKTYTIYKSELEPTRSYECDLEIVYNVLLKNGMIKNERKS
jgi:hypothetical protein